MAFLLLGGLSSPLLTMSFSSFRACPFFQAVSPFYPHYLLLTPFLGIYIITYYHDFVLIGVLIGNYSQVDMRTGF